LRGLHGAIDRARVDRCNRKPSKSLGQPFGLGAALVGERDAGRAAGQQRTGLRGDRMASQHESRRANLLVRRLGRRGRLDGFGGVGHGRAIVPAASADPSCGRRPARSGSWPQNHGGYRPDVTESPINLSSAPDDVVLDREPADALAELDHALAAPQSNRRDAVADVVAHWPRFLDAWARLSELARDDVEAYACARTGYHRGLDRLRQSGWRGSQYVRWQHEENRGFLRAVAALQRSAAAIGETDEVDRCAQFLHQLEPEWDRVASEVRASSGAP
jgi:hypothetical protein